MAISSQKLLPQAGSRGIKLSSSMIRVSNVGAVRKFSPRSKGDGGISGGALVPIYGTLIKINGIISRRAKEETKEIIKKRNAEDKKEKEKEEKQLESKSKKNILNLPKRRVPGMSFLDRLKNALTLLFVGWLVNTFFDYLPKIMEGANNFLKGVEILQKYLSPITNALGKALYSVTLAGTKMLGAITGAQIDKNEKDLAVAINELDKKFSILDALMASIIIGDIFSAVADGLDLFERPKDTAAPKRNILQRGLRNAKALTLKGARNRLGSGVVRGAGKVFGRIPIIGGLINFVISLALGEKPGRAAARAVGSTVGAGLGTLIPVPFAGTILGGFLGDLLGGAVYDMFAPRDTGKKGPKKKTEKPKGYFFGGLVGGVRSFLGGKPSKGSTQKLVQQQKISTQAQAPIIKPVSIDNQVVDKIGQKVAEGFSDVGSLLSSTPYVGPFAALGLVLALGKDRLSKSNALGIASGIGNLLGNPLSNAIYNFFDKAMPGLGNLVQRVVGKDFGTFLSNWITSYLGETLYKLLSPQFALIKFIMNFRQEEARKAASDQSDKDEEGTPLGEGQVATAKNLLDGLVKRGFSKEEAAAIVGNLYAESGFRTDATNPKSGAYGLMQWLGGRKSRLIAYAKEKGKKAADLELQLDYIKWELKGGNSYETSQFAAAMAYGNTIAAKTRGFAEQVERASAGELSSSMKKRIGAAQSAYGKGGGTLTKENSFPVNVKSMKPYSPSATSYSGVSRFAPYDQQSTKLQVVRQIVYVPMNQKQSSGGMIIGESEGVNNIDYQIAVSKATA